MTDTPMEFDTEHEFDPGFSLEIPEETCTAFFFGGPLDGVRDPNFGWDENYRSGNSFFGWPVWKLEDPADPESLRLLGSHQYRIEVVRHKSGERLITCKNEGFSDEGC